MATATELDRLVVKLVGDGSSYQQMLGMATAQTQQFTGMVTSQTIPSMQAFSASLNQVASGFTRMGAGISRMGRRLTLFVTGPLALFALFAIKAFGDFDSAMTKSTAIMSDVTDTVRREMEDTARALAETTTTAPRELADAYFFLASAGLNAQESIEGLSRVNNFAIAGMFDMAQATDLLTDAQSALGLNIGDTTQKMINMERVADTLVKANTLANATVEQFSIALTSKAGAALKAFNKDVEEGTAVLAAFADQGVKAQLAGNQLDRVIRLLSKSSMDNAAAHRELGFAVFDEAEKMRNLGDIIENLEVILAGMSDQQKVLTLDMLGFQARVQQAILPLIGTSKAIKEYEKELRSASGITQEVAEKQLKSFWSQLKITWNQLTVMAEGIGKLLVPTLQWLNDRLREGIAWFQELDDSTKRWIIGISALVAAIGPLLLVVGALITAVGTLIGVVAAFLVVGWEVVAIAAAIVAAMGAIIAVMAAVGAAIAGVIYWIVGPEGLAQAWNKVVVFAQQAWEKITGFLANFQTNMQILITWLQNNWQAVLVDMLNLWVQFNINMAKNAGVAIKTLFRLFNALNGYFAGLFAQIFTVDFVNWVNAGIIEAAKRLASFGEKLREVIVGILSGKKIDLSELFGQMEGDFKGGSQDFLGTAKGILQDGLDEMVGPFEGFKSSIEEVPQFVFDKSKEAGAAVGEGLKAGAGDAAAAAQELVKGPSEEMVKLLEDVQALEERYQFQAAAMGMSTRQAEIYKLAQRGAGDEMLKNVRELDKLLTKMEEEQKLMDEGRRLTEAMRTPAEKLADREKELMKLREVGAISIETYNRALQAAREEFEEPIKITFNVSGIQAVEAGTAEALARLEEFRALANNEIPLEAEPPIARPVRPALEGGVAATEPEGRRALDAATPSADARMIEILNQIQTNTRITAEKPAVVLQEANI